MNTHFIMATVTLSLAVLAGCTEHSALTVTGGEPIRYLCEQHKIEVRYFDLSDQSLGFIKLALPNGQHYTLPQAMAASGARYTDDRAARWWSKGREGFVELRDSAGHWYMAYSNCKQQ
ncbi:MAG: MliC family protein [Aeromonas sp.]